MTQQLHEKLIADPGAPELPEMRLFGVIVGDIDDPKSWSGYPFASKGNPKKSPCAQLCGVAGRQRFASR